MDRREISERLSQPRVIDPAERVRRAEAALEGARRAFDAAAAQERQEAEARPSPRERLRERLFGGEVVTDAGDEA